MKSLLEFYAFFIAIKRIRYCMFTRKTHTHTHFPGLYSIIAYEGVGKKIRWWFTILEPLLWNRFIFTMWWIAMPWKTEIDLGNMHHLRFLLSPFFLYFFPPTLCVAFLKKSLWLSVIPAPIIIISNFQRTKQYFQIKSHKWWLEQFLLWIILYAYKMDCFFSSLLWQLSHSHKSQ